MKTWKNKSFKMRDKSSRQGIQEQSYPKKMRFSKISNAFLVKIFFWKLKFKE